MDPTSLMEDKTFFYPLCCHVCKRWNTTLITCYQCRMISYCNKEHQKQHWPQHKQICEAIKRVLQDKEYMNTEEISMKDWINIRNEYLNRVAALLQRDLKMEEIQMFNYPDSCVVCHRQDTRHRCAGCVSVTFCETHKFTLEHQKDSCKLIRQTFEMDKRYALTETVDISYVNCVSNETPFNDMKSFLDIYVPLNKNDIYLRMFQSNEVTDSLTVYFCMEKLNYLKCKTLIIHIIGPHVVTTREDLEAWKMLLILIPTLTTLTITFIQKSIADFETEVVTVSETKKLVAYMRYMCYQEYMVATDFQKPNFIVGFNADVVYNIKETNEYVDNSERTGKALAKRKYPCILVFDYLHQINLEMLKQIENIYLGDNPFRSLMLRRHYIKSDRIYYPNSQLIIFDDTDPKKIMTNQNNKCFLFLETTRE